MALNVKRIFENKFFFNILLVLGVNILIVIIFFLYLNIYTKHGKTIEVPKLIGQKIDIAKKILKERNLQLVIRDSIYEEGKEPLTVVEQSPRPQAKAKENRKIYLTIITDKIPIVRLPDLDMDYTQALEVLDTRGLKVKKIRYEPDIAENRVIKVEYEGKSIKKGFKLEKGSEVTLVLGDGMEKEKVRIQKVIGLTLSEATFNLTASGLLVGIVTYNENVTDKEEAVIYKQSPVPSSQKVRQGTTIDIWLK